MPFVTLLLDSNYLTSARHAPKKWNVNYITIAGLSKEEQGIWNGKYGEDWSSVDSELHKELAVVTSMLNTLETFGYQLLSSMTSSPRVAYKDTENNRECYIWTLYKQANMMMTGISSTIPSSDFCECTEGSPGSEKNSIQVLAKRDSGSGDGNFKIFKDIETIFRSMATKEQLHRRSGRSREEVQLEDYQGGVSQI